MDTTSDATAAAPAHAELAALHEFALLDPGQEELFDDLTGLAAFLCGAPVALVTLLDPDRLVIKSRHGMTEDRVPRALATAPHVAADADAEVDAEVDAETPPLTGTLLVVPDLAADPRFAAHAVTLGGARMHFYAGLPLAFGPGQALGTLCVLDTAVRQLSDAQRDALVCLARNVVQQVQLRRSLARAEGFFAGFAEHSPSPLWIKDSAGRYVMGNGALHGFLEQEQPDAADGVVGKDDSHFWPPHVTRELAIHDHQVLRNKLVVKTLETSDDGSRHWLVHRFPIDVDGEPFVGGSATEMTTEVEKERALVRHDNFYVLLSRLTAVISRARTLDALCLDTCRVVAGQAGIEVVDISRLSEGGGELRLFASVEHGGETRIWQDGETVHADWLETELATRALEQGRMQFSNDLQNSGCARRCIVSCMAIPLFANDKRWGVMSFYSHAPDFFDSFYQERAGEIGNEISFGLERLVNAQELNRLARTNPLTGLPSRLHFEEQVAALASAGVAGLVLLININRFDEISSAYGNTAAINLMRAIAQRLNLEFRRVEGQWRLSRADRARR